RKERKLTSIDPPTSNQAVRSSEEEYMVKNQIEHWLRLLEKLPLQQKNVLLLRDYHQFSYDEIAHMLNLTLANVKVLLFRGRQIIREQ
ncbi:RNA polymerase subunit sigma, partial [Pseudomonas aeruginosa]